MFDQIEDWKVIDSTELDAFIKAKFNKIYSCAKGADSGQDNYRKYDVGPATEYEDGWWFDSEVSLEGHNEALAKWEGWETSPDPGIILNELHAQGDLLAGKYLLLIWW